MKKNTKKGFTLAELLVVVAIIGVLVAIAIPVFTAQLDKAKAATDDANIRAAYAMMRTAELEGKIGDCDAPASSGTTTYYFQKDGTVDTSKVTEAAGAYALQGKHDDCTVPGFAGKHIEDNIGNGIIITYTAATPSGDPEKWELGVSGEKIDGSST